MSYPKPIVKDDYRMYFKNDILYIDYYFKRLDLDLAKSIISDRFKISQGNDQYIVVDGTQVRYWNAEARSFMGKKENLKYIKFAGMVSQNGVMINLFNWFLNSFVLENNFKIFSSIEGAELWIKNKMATFIHG